MLIQAESWTTQHIYAMTYLLVTGSTWSLLKLLLFSWGQ